MARRSAGDSTTHSWLRSRLPLGRAQLGFAEIAALRTVADALHRQRQYLGQALATFALAL